MTTALPSPATVYRAAIDALGRALRRTRPSCEFDDKAYCLNASDNLISDLSISLIEAEFGVGAGQELLGKFRAPHSSSALAVNSFAPIRASGTAVDLAEQRVKISGFEVAMPTGLRGTAPHIDVVGESNSAVVAIESKCLEPIMGKLPSFSPSYDQLPFKRQKYSRWFAEMSRIRTNTANSYFHLDVAQLIKHAFGLYAMQDERPVTLLYLFWEPLGADQWAVFARHREEIAELASRVKDDPIRFVARDYLSLWNEWLSASNPVLQSTARRVSDRYNVTLDCTPAPLPL